MKKYIGTKIIMAIAMSLADWRELCGKDQHEAFEDKPGYKVTYEDGYESWSPKEAFESAYRETTGMPFGLAVEALKKGLKVARAGWNGKDMWLIYVSVGNYDINCAIASDNPLLLPWIGMKTADNKFVPWLASQTDVLADDWQIVD